jgi:hypothetical protein
MNEPRFVIYATKTGRFLIVDTSSATSVVMNVEDTLEDADSMAHAYNQFFIEHDEPAMAL